MRAQTLLYSFLLVDRNNLIRSGKHLFMNSIWWKHGERKSACAWVHFSRPLAPNVDTTRALFGVHLHTLTRHETVSLAGLVFEVFYLRFYEVVVRLMSPVNVSFQLLQNRAQLSFTTFLKPHIQLDPRQCCVKNDLIHIESLNVPNFGQSFFLL